MPVLIVLVLLASAGAGGVLFVIFGAGAGRMDWLAGTFVIGAIAGLGSMRRSVAIGGFHIETVRIAGYPDLLALVLRTLPVRLERRAALAVTAGSGVVLLGLAGGWSFEWIALGCIGMALPLQFLVFESHLMLAVTRVGVLLRARLGSTFIPWEAIQSFDVIDVFRAPYLALSVNSPAAIRSGVGPSLGRSILARMFGSGVLYPLNFTDTRAQEIALMRELLQDPEARRRIGT